MKVKNFYRQTNIFLDKLLGPFGFTNYLSERCTFWRDQGENVCHVIMPTPLVRRPFYEVQVFAKLWSIEDALAANFPDNLGDDADCQLFLHSDYGVGPNRELFLSRTRQSLEASFVQTLRPGLLTHAIPFLEQFITPECFSRNKPLSAANSNARLPVKQHI